MFTGGFEVTGLAGLVTFCRVLSTSCAHGVPTGTAWASGSPSDTSRISLVAATGRPPPGGTIVAISVVDRPTGLPWRHEQPGGQTAAPTRHCPTPMADRSRRGRHPRSGGHRYIRLDARAVWDCAVSDSERITRLIRDLNRIVADLHHHHLTWVSGRIEGQVAMPGVERSRSGGLDGVRWSVVSSS